MSELPQAPAEGHETLLQQMLGLHFIGEYLATAVALIPTGLLLWAREMIGMAGEPGGAFIILAGLCSAGWLVLLEHRGRVRMTTPLLPIPLRWLIPFVLFWGFVDLFPG